MKALCVVPARGGSKRLPRKNVLDLCGKPLVGWSIEFAKSSGLFTKTVISSDDQEITDVAMQFGAETHGLRPSDLSGDMASSIDVVRYELDQAEKDGEKYDFVALMQPTTPYRDLSRWVEAFDILKNNDTVPSVIGVREVEETPYHMFDLGTDGEIKALFPDGLKMRSQDLPRTVVITGSMYIVRADALRRDHSLFFPTSRAVICQSDLESIDIDTADDFAKAELLLANATV